MEKVNQKKYFNKQLCENLRQLMSESRVSLRKLYNNTGVPVTTIQRMRDDFNGNPTISSLKPIADFFSITVNQLIGDEPLAADKVTGGYKENKRGWVNVPIISWEESIYWQKSHNLNAKNRFIQTDIGLSEYAYALEVEEEGWINLAVGTLLIIDPTLSYKHRDFIIVYKENEKRYPGFQVDKHPTGKCLPCCFKTWNTEEQLNKDNIIIGKT